MPSIIIDVVRVIGNQIKGKQMKISLKVEIMNYAHINGNDVHFVTKRIIDSEEQFPIRLDAEIAKEFRKYLKKMGVTILDYWCVSAYANNKAFPFSALDEESPEDEQNSFTGIEEYGATYVDQNLDEENKDPELRKIINANISEALAEAFHFISNNK